MFCSRPLHHVTYRLLLATLALFALGASAAAEPLRVVTYDLHGMSPGSNWQVRLFFIVQRLIELDPDLICLQKVSETLGGGGADDMTRGIAGEQGAAEKARPAVGQAGLKQ